MHELSITREVVEICESYAAGARVASVTLEIGELSGVVLEAVEFCFEACTGGTLLEGARLVVVRLPARARCEGCGAEFGAAFQQACPSCGGFRTTLLSGRELRVRELEVE